LIAETTLTLLGQIRDVNEPLRWVFKKCVRYAVLYAVLDISAKVVFSLLLLVVRPDEALGNESAYSPIPGGA